ncbi:MAG: hypothetical protein PUE01_02060 [Clostridiaceae bacterium]|nr:hypothetical protein [Clostridiaceae bacterium]
MFFFRKNKNKQTNGKVENNANEESFYLGVEDTFKLKDTTDIVVVGKVHGTIKIGSSFYITNMGDDNTPTSLSTVVSLEINRVPKNMATDTFVAVRIENGSKLNIKIGSVLFTRDITTKDVHAAYIHALGEGYISFRQMKLEQEDYDKMSLTDLAEIRRLYKWLIDTKKEQETKEIAEFNKHLMDNIGENMCSKILTSEELYTVINKKTGEPHMVSQTFINENGDYVTTPPDIILITKAYLEMWKQQFSPEKYDIVKIENGEDGKGIYNFLGSTFYLNGACGVTVLFNDFSIDAGMLVEKPDYSNLPKIQVPVTNPNLERWLLLIGQLNEVKTEDEKKIYLIYIRYMFMELAKAQFIIPMKMDGEMDPPDENGKTVLKKDTTMSLATQKGKGERDAIRMYTDWKRFRMVYSEADGWQGMIQPISGMIEVFDCAINVTEFNAAGCYVDKQTYEKDIKKYVTEKKNL